MDKGRKSLCLTIIPGGSQWLVKPRPGYQLGGGHRFLTGLAHGASGHKATLGKSSGWLFLE